MCARQRLLSTWDWLAGRFGEYEVAYLDPSVCDLLVDTPWYRKPFSGGLTQEQLFLRELTRVLTADCETKDLKASLKRGQLAPKTTAERRLQESIAQTITDFFPAERSVTLAYLLQPKSQLAHSADPIVEGSLVVVEGTFARHASLTPEYQSYIDTLYADTPQQQKRSIESILLDMPVPIAMWDRPVVGLMVDTAAFYQRATTVLMRSDWYPFVQVLGKYTKNHDGQTYLDVVALQSRPHPTLYEVLAAPRGQSQRCSLPGMLKHVQPILDKEVDKLTNGSAPPPGSYGKDYQLLYPIYVTALCCQLNGVDWAGLQSRAPHVARAVQDYVDQLQVLSERIEHWGMSSLILDRTFEPHALLPTL